MGTVILGVTISLDGFAEDQTGSVGTLYLDLESFGKNEVMQDSIRTTGAFVIPTLAGAVMWTNEQGKMKWARFLIQGGYQLTIFIVFGFLFQFWK